MPLGSLVGSSSLAIHYIERADEPDIILTRRSRRIIEFRNPRNFQDTGFVFDRKPLFSGELQDPFHYTLVKMNSCGFHEERHDAHKILYLAVCGTCILMLHFVSMPINSLKDHRSNETKPTEQRHLFRNI